VTPKRLKSWFLNLNDELAQRWFDFLDEHADTEDEFGIVETEDLGADDLFDPEDGLDTYYICPNWQKAVNAFQKSYLAN
jgi:hypothetical protein